MAHPAFTFYIHIDKKSNAADFSHLINNKNIFFIKRRTKIYWAGFGTIQATLNGFNEIPLNEFDYINVMSAQDFIIKPASYIYRYFTEHKGKEFITCNDIDGEWNVGPRIRKYHFYQLAHSR